MELDKVIAKRHSVRSFKKSQIDWKEVLFAIDAANQAPFAGNHNHLKFVIVNQERLIDKIAGYADQLWINEAKMIIVVSSDDSSLEKMYGEKGRIFGKQQAGAAIENLMLKLTDSGLSCCWVGSFDYKALKDLLKIPANMEIEAIIPIGKENPKLSPTTKKKPLESTIFWNVWNERNMPALFEN